MSQAKQLVVIGGGISGLAYAHYLRNFLLASNKTHLIKKITLLESNNYMGGSIKTHSFDDGIVHESGPRSIRCAGVKAKNTVALVESLGLTDKIVKIDNTSAAGRVRYVYTKGRLHLVPSTISKLLNKIPGSKSNLLSAVIRDVFRAKRMELDGYPDRDPPLYDFVAHRFGPDVAEYLLDPVLRGITAGDARLLSTRALFGEILEKEQAYGSVLSSMAKPSITKITHDDLYPNDILKSKLLDEFDKNRVMSYNLKTGLQTLTQRLSDSLLNTNEDNKVEIYNQSRVVSLDLRQDDVGEGPCSVTVKTVDGDDIKISCHHIISAIPSNELGKILPATTPMQTKIALNNVVSIKHAPVGCVTVEYRNIREPKVLQSFGFLTHSKEKSRILGMSFDSTMFPEIDRPHGSTRITCMTGGHWFKEMLGTSDVDKVRDSDLEQIAMDEIRNILKITAEPHRMTTCLWKTGIAQYEPGHVGRVKSSRKELEDQNIPLTLIGQSYDGVAVNDVVFGARQAANRFVDLLQ